MYLEPGDLLTAVEDCQVTLSYGQGKKTDDMLFSSGDVFEASVPTKVTGGRFHLSRARIARVAAKRKFREQFVRQCSLSIAALEMPDIGDPTVRQIEEELALRGAERKARLARAAASLKD